MNDNTKNMAKSVHDRLLNIARATSRRYNDLQQRFAMERFLYRLSISSHADRFALKGALAFLAWTNNTQIYRPTMDIDLLGRTANTEANLTSIFRDVAQQECQNDGLWFDADSVAVVAISEDAEYHGMRVSLMGRLANARLPIQIDIGFSDTPSPPPSPIELPCLLDFPRPQMDCYHAESSIAEKLHAILQRGELNSRMKDYADIWYLANHFEFDGATLAAAIESTFSRRETELVAAPVGLTDQFAQRPDKQAQWRAFLRRTTPEGIPADLTKIVADLHTFFTPILAHLTASQPLPTHWPTAGPWER